jgi:hypothetical protein
MGYSPSSILIKDLTPARVPEPTNADHSPALGTALLSNPMRLPGRWQSSVEPSMEAMPQGTADHEHALHVRLEPLSSPPAMAMENSRKPLQLPWKQKTFPLCGRTKIQARPSADGELRHHFGQEWLRSCLARARCVPLQGGSGQEQALDSIPARDRPRPYSYLLLEPLQFGATQSPRPQSRQLAPAMPHWNPLPLSR